jgi:hypothetical protein
MTTIRDIITRDIGVEIEGVVLRRWAPTPASGQSMHLPITFRIRLVVET